MQNSFPIFNAPFWRTVTWFFLIHVTLLRGSSLRPAAATPLEALGRAAAGRLLRQALLPTLPKMSHRSFLTLGKSHACYIWTSQGPREQ